MKVLADLGISTPRILGRINTVRNKIEHDYKSPEPEFVETAVDVSELFTKYVEKYWKRFRIDAKIEFENSEEVLCLDFDPSFGEFKVSCFRAIALPYNVINQFSIKVDDDIYFDFLKEYLKIYDEW